MRGTPGNGCTMRHGLYTIVFHIPLTRPIAQSFLVWEFLIWKRISENLQIITQLIPWFLYTPSPNPKKEESLYKGVSEAKRLCRSIQWLLLPGIMPVK